MRKTKKILSVALSLALAAPTALSVNANDIVDKNLKNIQAEFFVSPKGDDVTGDGTYERPFATLEAARDAVREINDNMTGDIYVFVAEGDYYMDETVVFNEEDSGTNGYQIVYRNLDELSSAKFIGGSKVESEWKLVERVGADADLPASAEGSVYKTHVGTDAVFNTLYVNDERATLARTQNLNQYPGFESALTPYMRSAGGGTGDLIYKAGDISGESLTGLLNAQERGDLDASVYMWDGGYWDWMTDTIPISAIDTNARRLTFKTIPGHPEIYRPKYATRGNARYFVQGNLGFLDCPGEYYFNKTTGDLYYYPEEGSGSIETQDIVIPKVKEIVRVEGTSRESMVENITFSGMQFKDTDTTEWYAYGWNHSDQGEGLGFFPKEAEGSTQPSYSYQTERAEFQFGNITLKNTKNITISKSHITNTGMFGIAMYLANQNTMIQDCLINYTGHGGINIDGGYPGIAGDKNGDGYSRDNTVTNTIIHNVGELVGQATGLTVEQSSYNTFSHLEVYNSPRRGVFITGGDTLTSADKNYNAMTDLYSHHNRFEYIYIHDCQQDGGDDGAFFGCWLYKGNRDGAGKPNYVNQMVVDSTGANPTMTDLGPNCINLDMGCSGFELSNVKSVNPMNFNIEVNTTKQYSDVIKYDNVNVDFGSHTNLIDTFDDSKMEYDKIGVTADYPAEYLTDREITEKPEDIYFEEDFEKGINWNKWSFKGITPKITTEWMSEGPMNGRQGLLLSGNGKLYREFDQTLNKIVTVKMFDRQNNNLAAYMSGVQNSSRATSFARVDDGENVLGLGLDFNNMSNYVVQIGDARTATSVPRTFGWHEFKFDYTSGKDVKLYIDDVLVETVDAEGFDYVSVGSDDGKGIVYYDQLYIYGGAEAEKPGEIPMPEPPAYDSSNDNKEQLNLDFEDGELPNFDPNDKSVMTVVEDPNNSDNLVVKHEAKEGHRFYQTDAAWKNYIVNLKWKFDGWGNTNVLNGAYDNFTIFVMTNFAGDERPSNPGSYQVIYRRNKNGTAGFPAGTPYFEISKHTRTSDVSLGRAAIPEGFVESEWHSLQIQTFGGKVGFVIDGKEIMSTSDGTYTYGGVGFGGINATVYMDDIQIVSNPTYVHYAENFGLTNAKVNGNFNPEYFSYSAEVIDKNQPITVTLPTTVLDGVRVVMSFNGADITDQFVGEEPVALELMSGMNTLMISEITSAGSKDYTVCINNQIPVHAVEELEDVSTTAGTLPELPKTAHVTYEDGSEQDVEILWDMINPWLYKFAGSFEMEGKLADLDKIVRIKVNVDGIRSVDTLQDVMTTAGTAPVLPKTVTVKYLSSEKELPLQFAAVSEELYKTKGTVVIPVKAEGCNKDMLQKVIVMDDVNGMFTITVDGKSKTHKYNDPVTITAPAKEGKRFAGWEVNGEIISYKEVYKFYVSQNMSFKATYVPDTDKVTEEAKAMLTNVFVTKRADEKSDVKFVGELSLPEGCKLIEAGLVWSSKDTPLVVDKAPNKELKPTYIKKISDTNQFSVTIKGMPKDRFIRGVIFAKVEDENGKQTYIFSDEEKAFAAQ